MFNNFKSIRLLVLIIAISLHLNLNASSLFPEIDGWKLKSEVSEYTADNLWNIINGAADKYLQFNFEKLYYAVYEAENGSEINVYVYQHADLNNTFGIYQNERYDGFIVNGIGTEGYTVDETVNFFKGQYYVKLYSNTKGTAAEIEKLARAISGQIESDNTWPKVFGLFPTENLDKNSIKFVPEDLLGLGFMPAGFIANYSTDEGNFQVFILETESAFKCQQIISDYLAFAKQCVPVDENTVLSITDKYNGLVQLIWKGKNLFGLVGEPSVETSQEITNFFINL